MAKKTENPSQGKLLISEPSLRDFYFGRSVVLLIEHNPDEGTIGLILNKPINLKLNEVVKDFPQVDFPLYLGGPVHPERLYYLHTLGNQIPGSIEIIDGLFWGGQIERLIALINAGEVAPDQVRFFIGYAGWESGQLNRELGEKSWIVTQSNIQIAMHTSTDKMWSGMLRELGNDYAIWANYPSDPILN